MRTINAPIFDDFVAGTAETHSSDEFDALLSSADQLSIQLVATEVSYNTGGAPPTLSAELQTSNDGRNWVPSRVRLPARSLSLTETNVLSMTNIAAQPPCSRVRLAVTLGGTEPQTRLRAYVCGRQASRPWTPGQVTGAKAWYRADLNYVDGEWPDNISAFDVTQATASQQPTLATTDPDFDAQTVLRFNQSDSEFLKAATASDWTFMHDGSGVAVRGVFRCTEDSGTDVIVSTASTSTSTDLGLTAYVDSGTKKLVVQIGNSVGGGQNVLTASSATNSCPKDTVHWFAFRYEEGATGDEYKLWLDGALVANGDSTNSPSATTADNPLTVGSVGTGGDYFGGKIAEVDVYAMSAAEADFMIERKARLYTKARYGL